MSAQVVEAPPSAPEERDPPADQVCSPWRRSWIIGTGTWFAAVCAYVLVSALSWMIADKPGPNLFDLYKVWDHWDTGHYMRIAQEGYLPERTDAAAFFPLYPILVRSFDLILPGPTLIASLVVANLACVGALVLLHRFTAREFDRATADRAVLFLMVFPTGFFLSAGYNGSLFLLLSVATLYLLRGGRWWAAGAVGALASATRLAGVLLALVFLLEYGRQRGWSLRNLRPDFLAIALMPLGVVGFSLFCWSRFGDPLAFTHAQALEGWGRQTSAPWVGLNRAWQTIDNYPVLQQVTVHNLIDVVAVVFATVALVLCVVGPWRLPRSQVPLVVYSAVSLLLVLISPAAELFPLMGAPRYIIEFVPIFLLLARVGAHRVVERIYVLPAFAVQVVFLLTFLNNVWVA